MSKGFRSPSEFIQGASSHTVVTEPPQAPPKPAAGPKPWELANPRVKVPFTLRMDEPLHAKLAYLAEVLPGKHSMHSIMMEAASEKLDALIQELDGKG